MASAACMIERHRPIEGKRGVVLERRAQVGKHDGRDIRHLHRREVFEFNPAQVFKLLAVTHIGRIDIRFIGKEREEVGVEPAQMSGGVTARAI